MTNKIFLLALVSILLRVTASADDTARPSKDPGRPNPFEAVRQAFLNGTPVPEVGPGPRHDEAVALREVVARIQEGTDGSGPQKEKMLRIIEKLSKQIGHPKQPVIEDYLSRVKPAPRAAPQTAAASPIGGQALDRKAAGELARTASEAAAWRPRVDDVAGPSPGASARAATRPPTPTPAPAPRPAELRAMNPDTTPLWNPSGKGEFLGNIVDYAHSWLFLKNNMTTERLARLDREAEEACASGWKTEDCIARKTKALGVGITRGVGDVPEKLTSDRVADRQKGAESVLPGLHLVESGPATYDAAKIWARDPSLRNAAGLAMQAGGMTLDAMTVGLVAAFRKGMLEKAFEETAVKEASSAELLMAGKAVDIGALAKDMRFVGVTKKAIPYDRFALGSAEELGSMPRMSYAVSPADGVRVVTITKDGVETANTAAKGDIIMSGANGERYVVKPEKFAKLYQTAGERVIPEQSRRLVTRYSGEPVTFTAPWGEKMVLKPGDYLVKDGESGYYRIAADEYAKTYNPLGE